MPLPIQLLVSMLVGWVSRAHQDVIEYSKAENRALRAPSGKIVKAELRRRLREGSAEPA
jgi:hypothetical protein